MTLLARVFFLAFGNFTTQHLLFSARENSNNTTLPRCVLSLCFLLSLEAELIVNKLGCKEYHWPEDSNEDTPNSATRYIEAQDGADFTIRSRLDRRFKHINGDLAFGILLERMS